jgi:hypothetical protein
MADASGSVIVGASVQATNVDTGVREATATSSGGLYKVPSLIPGKYRLEVACRGFENAVVKSVTMTASQTTTAEFVLVVGGVTTSVVVSAQATMLDQGSQDVATTVQSEVLINLPYVEQSALSAIMLVLGVRGDPAAVDQVDGENAGISSSAIAPGTATMISGGMPGSTSMMIDGSDVTQASIGRTAISLSASVVQEVTVITNGVPAKYGRTGGGIVVQASKTGGNQLHGNLSWRHSESAFYALPFNSPTPTQAHRNFFGIYAGGPVWIPKVYRGSNKTFSPPSSQRGCSVQPP